MLSKEMICDLFYYNNGSLYWKVNKGTAKAGNLAGANQNGYRRIIVNGKSYLAHRIIFLMANGYIPDFIDHIDGNPSNNNLENLREASRSQNNTNCKIRKDSSSGVKGVGWHKSQQKWRVRIGINNKSVHVGYFQDLELAELVAIEARNKYHGNFAKHQ